MKEYTKTISYGDYIEIYEYEFKPREHSRIRDEKDGEVSEEIKFGKREDNILQTKRNFRRLVLANFSEEKPLLINITYKENMTDIVIAYKHYRSFVQALRYKYGKEFKYIAVPEFQKRGAVHFHALFWGLPYEVYSEERQKRTIFHLWGDKGFVDVVQTDGNDKLSSYLSKYMAKAFSDRRLKNQKAYVSSRNILRPVIESNPMLLAVLFEKVGPDDKPVHDKEYETRYLGKCRYRLFKVNKEI